MSASEKIAGGIAPPEPFRSCAQKYHEMGLSVIPCGKKDGKKPLLHEWKPYQSKLPSAAKIEEWCNQFPDANIGIITGNASGITVIDCDNAEVKISELFAKFGETPVVVRTPRPGWHCYYRFNGEKSSRNEALQYEVKSQGNYVIAPPSVNPQKGDAYRFQIGDLVDFVDLPMLRREQVDEIFSRKNGNVEGIRNNQLFSFLKDEVAWQINNFEELLAEAYGYNRDYNNPPLPDTEVKHTASTVWGYKEKGTLYVKGDGGIKVPIRVHDLLLENPMAYVLYADLLRNHTLRKEPFAISAVGYGKRLRWAPGTVRNARNMLAKYDLIQRVHKSKGIGNPDKWVLVRQRRQNLTTI